MLRDLIQKAKEVVGEDSRSVVARLVSSNGEAARIVLEDDEYWIEQRGFNDEWHRSARPSQDEPAAISRLKRLGYSFNTKWW